VASGYPRNVEENLYRYKFALLSCIVNTLKFIWTGDEMGGWSLWGSHGCSLFKNQRCRVIRDERGCIFGHTISFDERFRSIGGNSSFCGSPSDAIVCMVWFIRWGPNGGWDEGEGGMVQRCFQNVNWSFLSEVLEVVVVEGVNMVCLKSTH